MKFLYLTSLGFAILGIVLHDWLLLSLATTINAIAGLIRNE